MSGILFIIAWILQHNYMPWGYIGPCLVFDFANLVYLIVRIILWFKGSEETENEDSGMATDLVPPAFTPPTNDIGNAHIQTVTELPSVENLSEGHNSPSSGVDAK